MTSRSRSSDPAAGTLVGRARELRILDERLERLPGRGSVLMVRGEAGIGKSALLAEACRRAEACGVRVLNVTRSQSCSREEWSVCLSLVPWGRCGRPRLSVSL